MTEKEAIQMLERLLDPDPWEDYGLSDKAKQALQMGVDALEKQVPKIVRIGHEYLNKYRHVFYCPNCKHMDVGDVEK